jgi:hypothetical protein
MMVRLIGVISAALLLILLTSCKYDVSPISSGNIEYVGQDRTLISRSLSTDQIRALSGWINRSNGNWDRCLYTPPASKWSLILKHVDGTTSQLELLKGKDVAQPTTLMAVHLSGSNLSDQPCAFQKFAASDIDALQNILGLQ